MLDRWCGSPFLSARGDQEGFQLAAQKNHARCSRPCWRTRRVSAKPIAACCSDWMAMCQTYPRLRAARKLPTYLQVIVGVKAKNRFRKLIRITGTRFTRNRRNDNWMSGPHFDLGHVLGRLVRSGVALSPAVIKPRLTAGIDPAHRLFLGSSLENFFRGSAFKRGPYGPYGGMRYPSDDQFWLFLSPRGII